MLKRNTLFAITGTALFGLACFAPASAAVVTTDMTLTDDRNVNDSDGDGVGDALGPQDDGFLRVFGVGGVWRGLIEFDISSLAAGGSITNATLSLRDEGTSQDGRIDVYGYAGDGTVSIADSGNLATLVASFTITQANGIEDFALDVTSLLQSLYANGDSFAGFVLVSESNSFNIGGSDICSSEASNGTASFSRPNCVGHGPRLSVTFDDMGVAPVPLPAALPLFATGLAAGFAARRKRRKAA
ncbi:MAG: DNRLRE domain-containing protein [Parvularcula sp.]